jgi:hypothetical protein
MREDMFKVIVERPRPVNSNGYSRDGRKFRNDEDAPTQLSGIEEVRARRISVFHHHAGINWPCHPRRNSDDVRLIVRLRQLVVFHSPMPSTAYPDMT